MSASKIFFFMSPKLFVKEICLQDSNNPTISEILGQILDLPEMVS